MTIPPQTTVLVYSGTALTIAALSITTYYDIRSRDVDPRVWIPFIIPGAVITFVAIIDNMVSPLWIAFSYIAPAITLLAMITGLMGGADFLALLTLTLLNPVPTCLYRFTILPPSLITLAYSVIAMCFLSLSFLIINLAIFRHELARVPWKYRVVYAFTALPLKVSTVLKTKFWYLLEIPWNGKFRLTFNIEEDPSKHRAKLRELIERNSISQNCRVWCTWGVPHILLYLIGYLLYLIIGDFPLVEFIKSLLFLGL